MNLPSGEAYVSSFVQAGANFRIRFVNDYHPEVMGESEAFCLELMNVENFAELSRFLAKQRDSDQCVYLVEIQGGLSIAAESGDEVQVNYGASGYSSEPFNTDELRKTVARTYAWYAAEHKSLCAAMTRINSTINLAVEQSRRVAVKAEVHEAGSTAATLYGQHLRFLSRIVAELKGCELLKSPD